jgi:hypothetical protein
MPLSSFHSVFGQFSQVLTPAYCLLLTYRHVLAALLKVSVAHNPIVRNWDSFGTRYPLLLNMVEIFAAPSCSTRAELRTLSRLLAFQPLRLSMPWVPQVGVNFGYLTGCARIGLVCSWLLFRPN